MGNKIIYIIKQLKEKNPMGNQIIYIIKQLKEKNREQIIYI
jgi:hypothetical protein